MRTLLYMTAFAVLLSGCEGVTPGAGVSGGAGGVLARFEEVSSPRTIIPTFARYVINFYGADRDTVTVETKAPSASATLLAGDWMAEAQAFFREDDTAPAASGLVDRITIIAGKFSAITIPLTISAPETRDGAGSFAYTVSLPDHTSAAELVIGTTKVNLLTEPEGRINALAAGDYLVTLSFRRQGNPVIAQKAVVADIAQIYDAVETAFAFTAADAAALSFSFEPAVGLYFDHGRRITDADLPASQEEWEAQNTCYVPAGEPVVLAPVAANVPSTGTVSYAWRTKVGLAEEVDDAETSQFFEKSFSEDTLVKVALQVDAVTAATASIMVKPRSYTPRSGGSRRAATRAIGFSPAPGQFVGRGNGYSNPSISALASRSETEALDIIQEYMDGKRAFNNTEADGKVFSLGGWGGYYTVHFDHSVENKPGEDLYIDGNFNVARQSEPGIVWVSQDINGDGIPNEIWHRLAGSQGAGNVPPTSRYGICYFKPHSSNSAFYIDTAGRSEKFPWWNNGNDGFPYHITGSDGTWVLFSGILLDHAGNPDYGGYVDSGTENFDIADAVDERGNPVSLNYIDFVKIQVGLNRDLGGLGEASTEAGTPEDIHFQ